MGQNFLGILLLWEQKFKEAKGPRERVGIISGTEQRNRTTASLSGFYKNMINYGTEWRNAL